ncbi:MAG: phosphocholine cytidylyltransferase family protein [Geminicoccaceae bacterium]|nr:phosphocholine cytidylyltransferase family protein [Geminicoccaceae bacterium]
MKVAMLAAGTGSRLGQGSEAPPKALLSFRGRSLLERHLAMLKSFGLEDLTIATGYRAETIRAELTRLGAGPRVRTRFNTAFRSSSLLSLWTVREVFRAGEPVLYMDADVLTDRRMMARLLEHDGEDALLVDRRVDPGDDPLKVALKGGQVVDFHKRLTATDHDQVAEWIGFMRLGAESAHVLAAQLDAFVAAGRTEVIYEEPIRATMLERGSFRAIDVTGLPWIEIDFPEDLERAKERILPELQHPDDV